MIDNYVNVLSKYAVFDGRASRHEYWMFVVGNMIVGFVLGFIAGLIGEPVATYMPWVLIVAILLPSIAVAVRRLHDVGKSGWWMLIALIPIIGSIWLLVLFVTDGQPGANQYGPNPKEVAA